VHNLINNVLHNLTRDQQDATQFNKVKMLMSYVSYRHALMTFKVELSKWEMEVALMHIEFAYHNSSMGKRKWSMNRGGILELEYNMANTCI